MIVHPHNEMVTQNYFNGIGELMELIDTKTLRWMELDEFV